MSLPIVDDLSILALAVEQASSLRHHLFDTLYHAVALAEDATLITADEAYYRKARHLGHIVRLAEWLEAAPGPLENRP